MDDVKNTNTRIQTRSECDSTPGRRIVFEKWKRGGEEGHIGLLFNFKNVFSLLFSLLKENEKKKNRRRQYLLLVGSYSLITTNMKLRVVY